MNITKQLFIEVMKDIEKQLVIDTKNHEAFSTLLENDYVSNLKNILYGTLLKLLTDLTNDIDAWIEHFIYELDFGKENWRLKVYDKDNNEIPLGTIEDLWNILST